MSQAKSGQNPQFTEAEIAAIVAAARDYDFRVAAHAHGTEGMRRAVAAGVNSIEHGTYMTDEVMELMKQHGTWYVPTIAAGKFVGEKAEIEGYFSEVVRPKAAAIGPVIFDTFARAYAAGVKIAFGTDTGVSPHGENWKEFIYMVEGGMPVMEAIVSATRSAADLLNKWDELGSIEAGKYADIIAVPGDPREDVEEFGRVHFVMKGGEGLQAVRSLTHQIYRIAAVEAALGAQPVSSGTGAQPGSPVASVRPGSQCAGALRAGNPHSMAWKTAVAGLALVTAAAAGAREPYESTYEPLEAPNFLIVSASVFTGAGELLEGVGCAG